MADSMHRRTLIPLLLTLAVALGFAMIHTALAMDVFQRGPLGKTGLLHILELKLLDLKFQLQPYHQDLRSKQVMIAAVDEKGVETFGLWPWSRSVIAQLIEKVTQANAKVIGFDAVFADQMNQQQQAQWELIQTLQQRQTEETKLLAVQHMLQNKQHLIDEVVHHPKWKHLSNQPLGRSLEQLVLQSQSHMALLQHIVEQQLHVQQTLQQQRLLDHPDKMLEQAIALSPISILGYFHFYRPEEMVGIRLDEQEADKQRLLASGLRQIFRKQNKQMGEQQVTIIEPATDVIIEQLHIPTSVGAQTPLPQFTQKAGPMGYFNVAPDPDGPMRRIPLLTKLQDQLMPSLSLLVAAKALDVPIQPLESPYQPGLALQGIELDPGNIIPTDGSGQMLVRYLADPVRIFPTYSVAEILQPNFPTELLKDQIILFGMTAQGLFDLRPTPFSATTPGVYIHASAIENMLQQKYLQRPAGLFLLEILGTLLCCCALAWLFPTLPIFITTSGTLAMIALYGVMDIAWLFPKGYWTWNVVPVLQVLVTTSILLLHSYFTQGREKQQIRQAFQFYLNKSVVDEMLKDTSKLRLGGERRVCTVLFSDVRGFTTISEQLSPEALVQLLNSYLTPMTNIVFQHKGTLDKYMGDAIMAFFGAPLHFPNHALLACEAALDMMAALTTLQTQWKAKQWPNINIGIGINTGMVAVGNMGSETRFDYTVMGDNVNLGSRLEGITKTYGVDIILSEMTYSQVRDQVYARQLDSVRVKGKHEPVAIYELLGRGQADATTQQWLTAFDQARHYYTSQAFDQAKALFQHIHQELKPHDPPSQLYLERIVAMEQEPPPANWDGIYTMKTK